MAVSLDVALPLPNTRENPGVCSSLSGYPLPQKAMGVMMILIFRFFNSASKKSNSLRWSLGKRLPNESEISVSQTWTRKASSPSLAM